MAPTDVEVQQAVGKPNPRNNSTMFKIFQNVQYNVVQHKKYVKEMIKLYKKVGIYMVFIFIIIHLLLTKMKRRQLIYFIIYRSTRTFLEKVLKMLFTIYSHLEIQVQM